jgi:hypothetical protein
MLTNYNLKYNPFSELTPELQTGKQVIWAGMSDVKRKIEKVYTDSLTQNPRQVILNWGPWGGGKTFAAMYFINKTIAQNEKKIKQAYIVAPKKGQTATDEFFVSILDAITFQSIIDQVKFLIEKNGVELFTQQIGSKIASVEFAKAIALLASDEDDTAELMHRYFYTGVTKSELKKLKLPRDIASDSDSVKVLTGIIYCFMGDGKFYDGKFCLWIDEMEDLIYYSSAHYRGFSQILRELIDKLNDRFTIFFNFTLSEPEEKTIELLLGAALWSRITKKIRFKELTVDDAIEYIDEQLSNAKINKKSSAPISKSHYGHILSYIPLSNMTPREINKFFGGVLNFMVEKKQPSVDETLIDEFIKSKTEDD